MATEPSLRDLSFKRHLYAISDSTNLILKKSRRLTLTLSLIVLYAPQLSAYPTLDDGRPPIYRSGGTLCVMTYTLWDYYSNGVYTGSQWEPSRYQCYTQSSGPGAFNGSPSLRAPGGGLITAPNPPNPWYADCRSSKLDRWGHANFDAAALALQTAARPIPAGTVIKVTYDDGGTELWIYNGPLLSEKVTSNVPGSLKCP